MAKNRNIYIWIKGISGEVFNVVSLGLMSEPVMTSLKMPRGMLMQLMLGIQDHLVGDPDWIEFLLVAGLGLGLLGIWVLFRI